MHPSTLLTLALVAATTTTAHLNPFKRQTTYDPDDDESTGLTYLQSVCMPLNSTSEPDLSAPCWQDYAITYECAYGSPGLSAALENANTDGYGISDDAVPLSNETQRDCVCSSQFFAAIEGCSECYKAHGASEDDNPAYAAATSVLESFSSSYCAVTNTPTVGLADALYELVTASALTASVETAAETSTFSDPIGNSTAVSLYWTPSVTGSAAWYVAEATETAGSETASVRTSAGQIVATAAGATGTSGAASSAAGSSKASASSSSSAAGAQQTASVVGVVALAGIVALL
ncbi:hypothetical protein Tdes44962_MAKER02542 [Teratosphaeria destructans]|uniref:Uncharacterized protein n=1 Tax=Teratosphaeria destructans TaxID=418781 RepID=A0A9W7ST90_9PEZI|nr:hypothetical protein Tdes44962_MAKER02542 [Teratosphaeria destructans]